MPGWGGPPPGIDPNVYQWFLTVDADRSGRISMMELQQALVNANWTHFNPETCRLMIGQSLFVIPKRFLALYVFVILSKKLAFTEPKSVTLLSLHVCLCCFRCLICLL